MDLFEKSDDFFEFPDIQIGMLFKPTLLTIVFEDFREGMYPFAAEYGPIQLQEASVGVIGKTWVGGQLGQSFDDFIVDAEVEQGIHHPGHGNRSLGTNRNEQRIDRIAEFRSLTDLHLKQRRLHFFHRSLGNALPETLVLEVGLGGDDETKRHRHAK